MENVLLHCCCAPCSLSCIEPLRQEGIEPVAFWYNPNIHPWKEYEARRDCLTAYAPTIGMELRVQEDYGLREFVRHVANDIEHRCTYCYEHRLEGGGRRRRREHGGGGDRQQGGRKDHRRGVSEIRLAGDAGQHDPGERLHRDAVP